MFKNEYQGGLYVEVFSAQGKDPVNSWKLNGGANIKKVFDKDVKSFVYYIEGNGATTRMQLPKDSKHTLMLVQQFLIFQALFPRGQEFSIDIGISDQGNNKRRLLLSSAHKEFHVTPLHARVPLTIVKREVWVNLCLDLASLVSETWRGQTFKAVDSICICANCRLRKILTMRVQPADTTDDDEVYGCSPTNNCEVESIPKHFQLALDVPQETQVLTVNKLKHAELKSKGLSHTDTDLNSSGGKKSNPDSYHIAFGTKVATSGGVTQRKGSASKDGNQSSRVSKTHSKQDEIPTARKSSSAGSTSRVDRNVSQATPREGSAGSVRGHAREDSAGSVRGHAREDSAGSVRSHTREDSAGSVRAHIRKQKTSEPGSTEVIRDKENIEKVDDMAFVKPHPPREPSSDRARRRPRVRSAGKERNHNSESNTDHNDSSGSQTLTAVKLQVETNGRERVNDSLTDIINGLKQSAVKSGSADELDDRNRDGEDENEAEYEDSDDELKNYGTNRLYTFSSPPKSAPRRNLSPEVETSQLNQRSKNLKTHKERSKLKQQIQVEDLVSARGPRPESDFHSSDSSDDERVQIKVTKSTPKTSPEGSLRAGPGDISSILASPPRDGSTMQKPAHKDGFVSPMGSQSRMSISKKSLREIPKDDKRLSQPKPYDYSKYQMSDFSDSMEANMLQALKQETLEEEENSSDEPENVPETAQQRQQVTKHIYGDDSQSSSSEDTSFSTWKIPPPADIANHYQTEMRIHPARLSQDTLLNISNPRDYFSLYSPPIVLPSKGSADERTSNLSSVKDASPSSREKKLGSQNDGQDTDDEEELDLLYDPVLNCYYDPGSCKYYELI